MANDETPIKPKEEDTKDVVYLKGAPKLFVRPSAKKCSYWKRRVCDLQAQRNRPQRGPWRPWEDTTFSLPSSEEINKFFDGQQIRFDVPADRANYAAWAIEKLLTECPSNSSLVAKHSEGDNIIILQHGAGKVQTTVAEAVQADGQCELDMEDGKSGEDGDGKDLKQSAGLAAHSLISSSLNTLGPPINPCAMYLDAYEVGAHGPKGLITWGSEYLVNPYNKEEGRQGFLPTQITAIVWIMSRLFGGIPRLKRRDGKKVSRERRHETPEEEKNREVLKGPRYSGAILADSMGLGKTLTVVACIELIASQRLNVRRDENGKKQYHPFLILTPNHTVSTQWIKELLNSTSDEAISHIVTLPESNFNDKRVYTVEIGLFQEWPAGLQFMWDSKNKNAAKSIVIMSIDTWSRRTAVERKDDDGSIECASTFTDAGRKFSLVVVDEAFKVKNPATRIWRSVELLDRQFTLLVTATPCMNTLSDLFGLVRLLWNVPAKYSEKDKSQSLKQMEQKIRTLEDLKLLDDLDIRDDAQILAGHPGVLSKMLCLNKRSEQNIGPKISLARGYLHYFERLAILRRGPSSVIFTDWDKTNAVPLDGLLPRVDNRTVNLELDKHVAVVYQSEHLELLLAYLKFLKLWARNKTGKNEGKRPLRQSNSASKPQLTRIYRSFAIASASMDVARLDKVLKSNGFGTTAPHISTMRGAGVTLPRLACILLEGDEPEPRTCYEWVRLAVRHSPVLRYIMEDIGKNVLTRPHGGRIRIKKLLITEHIPILAYYYEVVLQYLGINCRAFHAGLSTEEREELISDFNSDRENSCCVLIQMYTVGFAGTNLHQNCSRVLVASQAHSLPVQWQAVHRVIRVGQKSQVQVTRVKVNNSFHGFRESRQAEKMLPELASRANGNMAKVLVQLLNLFQREITEAWEQPENKILMHEQCLLSTDPEVIEQEAATRGYMNEDELLQTDGFHSVEERVNWIRSTWDSEYRGFSGLFLQPMTRLQYYTQYKGLKDLTRSFFSHEKNMRRRHLSYAYKPDTWDQFTAEDGPCYYSDHHLDHQYILERALELLLQVRLGADRIAMLPIPQIDLKYAKQSRRKLLWKYLKEVAVTDQDIGDNGSNESEGIPAGLKRTFRSIQKSSNCPDEMLRALDHKTRYKNLKTFTLSNGERHELSDSEDTDDSDEDGDTSDEEEGEGDDDTEDSLDESRCRSKKPRIKGPLLDDADGSPWIKSELSTADVQMSNFALITPTSTNTSGTPIMIDSSESDQSEESEEEGEDLQEMEERVRRVKRRFMLSKSLPPKPEFNGIKTEGEQHDIAHQVPKSSSSD